MGSLTMRAYLPTIRVPGLAKADGRATATRRRPALSGGERVLMSERDAGTRRRVVATGDAVHYQDLDRGFETWHRLGWDEVERADWHAERAELHLVSLVPAAAPDLVLRSPGGRRLLDLARERVRATTLVHVPLRRAGEAAGWLAARRAAGGEGEVRWVVRPAPGVELTEAEIAETIRTVRVQTGL
jgi:hypothetical protein